MYGGREDKGMNKQNPNVKGYGVQKFINILKIFFADFMGLGHIATMNSAYRDKLATQVGQEVWKLNIVGTSQVNRTSPGDEVMAQREKMKVGTYELCFFNTRNYHFLLGYGLTTT